MSYSCRIYKASGFNSCNIPDSPDLLNTVNFIDVPTLNIMQDRFLSEIRVKATWSQVKNADYAYLYNDTTGAKWYYAVETINMTSKDVAVLGVVPDYINSIGGVDNLKIVDGITERVHVSDDTFGRYTASDPLTTPSEPLQIEKVWVQVGQETNTFLESTIDVMFQVAETTGHTYKDTDTETGETASVVVPAIAKLSNFTDYNVSGETVTPINNKTCVFNASDKSRTSPAKYNVSETLYAGLADMRSLGVDNAVINHASIPSEYVTPKNAYDIPKVLFKVEGSTDGYSINYVSELEGNWTTNDSGIPYVYTTAKNNRVNYGEFSKYGIITVSGESCEYEAEDIIETGKTAPSITKVGDPRLDGKPYFRFTTVNGDSSKIGFFRNCVAGLQWKQVPLVFNQASGSVLNTLRYENSKAVSVQAFSHAQFTDAMGVASGALNLVTGGAVSSSSSDGRFGQATAVSNPLSGLGGVLDMVSSVESMYNRQKMTNISRRNELADLEIANTVVTPTVNFPMNAEFMRDFFGNGCLIYRYKYSNNDIARIDKLLTMYGYRFAKALTKSDFTNRTSFNFVKCSNVTVTGHARWINDGIHEQLANGVRVWHVLPDSKYYTDNPIKG